MGRTPLKYRPRPGTYLECPECEGEDLYVSEFDSWIWQYCDSDGSDVFEVPLCCEACGHETTMYGTVSEDFGEDTEDD